MSNSSENETSPKNEFKKSARGNRFKLSDFALVSGVGFAAFWSAGFSAEASTLIGGGTATAIKTIDFLVPGK